MTLVFDANRCRNVLVLTGQPHGQACELCQGGACLAGPDDTVEFEGQRLARYAGVLDVEPLATPEAPSVEALGHGPPQVLDGRFCRTCGAGMAAPVTGAPK